MTFESMNIATFAPAATAPAPMASKPARSTSPRRRPRFSLKWAAGFVDGEGCICIVKQTYKCCR